MSIFREVVVDFLFQGIDLICKRSIDADQSVVSNLRAKLPFFKWERDANHAKNKRDVLVELKTQLKDLVECCDEKLIEQCRVFITEIQTRLFDLCMAKNYTTGTTEKSVSALLNFVNTLYQVICGELNLTNVKREDDAISCFKYYVAMICARDLFETFIVQSPQNFLLLNDKKRIISKHLQEAIIDTIPRAFDEKTKARQIIQHAEAVIRECAEVDKQYWLAVGGPNLRLNEDYHHKYMACVVTQLSAEQVASFMCVERKMDETASLMT